MRRHTLRPTRAFTLIEVMVALLIMAVLAGMAWRGVDAIVHSKNLAQASTDRTLRLTTGMAQFEYDLSMLTDTGALNSLAFDGGTLRLTRRTNDGVQLVLWSLQDGAWQRWASAPTIHIADLQDAWLRSQQWTAIQADAMRVVPEVSGFQVYFYRGNGWSNAQSSGDVMVQPVVPPPPTPPKQPDGGGTPPPPPPPPPEGTVTPGKQRTITISPTGIRIVLTLPQGDITREKMLPPGGAGATGT